MGACNWHPKEQFKNTNTSSSNDQGEQARHEAWMIPKVGDTISGARDIPIRLFRNLSDQLGRSLGE